MSKVHTGHLKNARGHKLFWMRTEPDGKTLGSVLIAHGYAEHSGRYRNVVDALVPAGIQVFGMDLEGHGQSEGLRGYVESFGHYVEDLHQFYAEQMVPRLAGKKLFLLGHSMGSVIAMHYAVQHHSELAGLVLSGTGTSLAGTPKILTAVASVLSRVVPKLGLKSPHKNDFISHDPAVVQAYTDDPLVYAPHITVRLGAEFYQACLDGAKAVQALRLPMLMQYGSLDTSFSGQQALFDGYQGSDKTLHCYQGAKHECYNELPEWKDRALGDLCGWVVKHV
ncbi:MAG: lysophospholipase [Pseudomonadota bacterium]